ncbi:unannotated protein [freshwater metagenome]|uniref:Unannotated protein n=1 Tax=freshwater metagenome TaxID=449393 RepID=A0A6J7ECV4_9ZZZZ
MPLTEICMFVGIIVLLVGILGHGGSRGLLLAFGLTLVTLATIELTLREHLAGYRSHSLLIAALAAAAVAAPVAALVQPSKIIVLAIAAAVFALVFPAMRALFRRRSGGADWRA